MSFFFEGRLFPDRLNGLFRPVVGVDINISARIGLGCSIVGPKPPTKCLKTIFDYFKVWFKFRRMVQKSIDMYAKSMLTKVLTCIYLYDMTCFKKINFCIV